MSLREHRITVDLYWVDGVAYTEVDDESLPCMPDLGCESGVLTLIVEQDRDYDPPEVNYNELHVVGAYIVEDGRETERIVLSSDLYCQLREHFYTEIMELQ